MNKIPHRSKPVRNFLNDANAACFAVCLFFVFSGADPENYCRGDTGQRRGRADNSHRHRRSAGIGLDQKCERRSVAQHHAGASAGDGKVPVANALALTAEEENRISHSRDQKGQDPAEVQQRADRNEEKQFRLVIAFWENNKNLPDIEMVVDIARTFQLSLDELILGDSAENNMTAKLIKDGSDTRRAKLNLYSIFIGAVLLLMGIGCIIIQAFSVEYTDAAGYLHENFFLLPIGFLLLFCGLLSFLIAGIVTVLHTIIAKRKIQKDIAG